MISFFQGRTPTRVGITYFPSIATWTVVIYSKNQKKQDILHKISLKIPNQAF